MRNITLFILTLLLVSTLLISWKHSEAKVMNTDAATILELSKPMFQGEYHIQMKWSGEGKGYTSLSNFQTYNSEINQQLNIQPSDSLEYVNGLPLLRALGVWANGVQLQSVLVGSKDQQTTLWMLEIQTASTMTMEQIVQTQRMLEQKLSDLGLKGAWNTMVQGELTNTKLGERPEAFLHNMSDQIKGIEQETYHDDHTVSVSFLSKQIQQTVQSGTHRVNVQIALHQNSITKAWRLTIGSPLITIEY
ncbi:MAG: YwmB family TATA-box binding protein [Paenibacillaceae bacterium]